MASAPKVNSEHFYSDITFKKSDGLYTHGDADWSLHAPSIFRTKIILLYINIFHSFNAEWSHKSIKYLIAKKRQTS